MRRHSKTTILAIVILLLNTSVVQATALEPIAAVSLVLAMQPEVVKINIPEIVITQPLEHLTGSLALMKKGDLSFCLGHIRRSKDSNRDIANFILTWDPDLYRRQIPVIFRSKIDRVVKKLKIANYQQLIIDIDFIKNSQLTISQMIKMIKGTKIGRRRKIK